MEMTIKNADVRIELSIDDALELQASLARGIAHALKYQVSSAGVVTGPSTVNNDKKAYPGILSFSVVRESMNR